MKEIIPKSSLKTWAIERFHYQRQTMELMSCAKSEYERSVIAIVALMEVDRGIRYQGMNKNEIHYIKSCHNYLLTLAEDPAVTRGLSAL